MTYFITVMFSGHALTQLSIDDGEKLFEVEYGGLLALLDNNE
jgi:hypothetical protein